MFWSASYDNADNTVTCKEGLAEYQTFNAIIHELIHAFSYHSYENFPDSADIIERIRSGLTVAQKKKDLDGNEHKSKENVGLNEAITEYYAILARKKIYKIDSCPPSYLHGVLTLGILEDILGREIIKNAYFLGDVASLEKRINELSSNEKSWNRFNKALTQRIAYVTDIASVEDMEYTVYCENYIDDLLDEMIKARLLKEISDIKDDSGIVIGESANDMIKTAFIDFIYSKEGAPTYRIPQFNESIDSYVHYKQLAKRWSKMNLPDCYFGHWLDFQISAFRYLSFDQAMDCFLKFERRRNFENRICVIGKEFKKEHSDINPLIVETLERGILKCHRKESAKYYDNRLLLDVKQKAEQLKNKSRSKNKNEIF